MRAKLVFHKGYHFRSLTEARWAVFFEELGVPYKYEKETFKLEEGLYYLPDFWLPEQSVWVEIKGEPPNEEEQYKAIKLYEVTCKTVYILAGFPDVMSFQDPLGIHDHFEEICNFGTYKVDKMSPSECIPFHTGAANTTMMHILGLNNPEMQVHEFRILTGRFNRAATYGMEKSFFLIEHPDN